MKGKELNERNKKEISKQKKNRQDDGEIKNDIKSNNRFLFAGHEGRPRSKVMPKKDRINNK